MPQFWCCCLAADDTVVWGTYVDAPDLDAAIIAAHIACQEHSKTTTSRVEVWLGEDRLHVTSPRDNSGPVWTPP